jgi:hypothetical protein
MRIRGDFVVGKLAGVRTKYFCGVEGAGAGVEGVVGILGLK